MKIKWTLTSSVLMMAIFFVPLRSAMGKETQAHDCRLVRYASVNLTTNKSGNILVPVTINGHQASMALNLGSSFGVLKQDALEYLGLGTRRLDPNAEVRLGSETIKQYSRATDFVIGGQAKYGNMEFLVSKDFEIELSVPDVPPVVGLLGLNSLGNVDLELDLSAAKMNLYKPSSCPDQVVYWATDYAKVPIYKGKLGDLFFLMELDGKKLQTTFSTSDANTVLYTDVSRKLYDFDETSPGTIREPGDEPGKETTYYRAMELTNKGMKVLNAKIELNKRKSPCGMVRNGANDEKGVGYDGCFGAYPLKLGLNVLRKLHIYIASKEQALYFTMSDAGQVGDAT